MSHMWFQSASDSDLQNNVIHKFTLNIYTTLLCALLGLIGLRNSSKCISKVHYLTLLVPFSTNTLLNRQACLHRPPYLREQNGKILPWLMLVSRRTGSTNGLQSCDQISTLIPGRSTVFQKFNMEKGKCSFQGGKRLFWQTEVVILGFFSRKLMIAQMK